MKRCAPLAAYYALGVERRSLLAVSALVGALVLVASGAATTRSTRPAARQRTCPATIARSPDDQGIAATSRVLAAVRAGVPKVFRNYTTQGGGPGWHHYQVLGLLSLSGGDSREPGVITRYRRAAMRRCGRAVALDSWVIFLQFPEGPMASTSNAHMFVAKTRSGWRAWYGAVDIQP